LSPINAEVIATCNWRHLSSIYIPDVYLICIMTSLPIYRPGNYESNARLGCIMRINITVATKTMTLWEVIFVS